MCAMGAVSMESGGVECKPSFQFRFFHRSLVHCIGRPTFVKQNSLFEWQVDWQTFYCVRLSMYRILKETPSCFGSATIAGVQELCDLIHTSFHACSIWAFICVFVKVLDRFD